MTAREIIILAGGKGSRLASVNTNLPKCMVHVREHAFLDYIIRYYISQGIEHFIFSLGHLHQTVRQYLDMNFPGLPRALVVEDEPLGTGGAIKHALSSAVGRDVFIANGDTYFEADLSILSAFHGQHDADCTIALASLSNTERYGRVSLDASGKVRGFEEKGQQGEGMINGGIYLLNRERYLNRPLPRIFSFEKDYLQQVPASGRIYGLLQDTYFIDIGVPEDLLKAQNEMPAYDE